MANRTSCVVVLAITLFASYLITSIRFYSRTLSKNGFRWNLSDSIIVASLVLQTVLTGIGLSSIYMSSTAKSQHVVLFIAGNLLYYTTIWSIKVSIGVSLLRLTTQLHRAARLAKCCLYLICATFVVVVIMYLSIIPTTIRCKGTCMTPGIKATFWISVGFNVSTDIMLIIVPFPALLLITERRTRIVISVIFSLGVFTILAAVTRAILIHLNCTNAYLIIILSHIEIATGLIISALPQAGRSFTKSYLQRLNTRKFSKWTPSDQQQSQGTTGGVVRSRDEKEGFSNLAVKSSQDRIEDVEVASTNGRSSEQSVVGFHNTGSTDQIQPYGIGKSTFGQLLP